MVRRILIHAGRLLLALVLALVVWVLIWTHVTRPRLDGERKLAGLSAAVTVTRDSLGVPDIQAANRADAARALGYLHGQERFFQMDLQRRGAAGELSALLGSGLLGTDRDVRRHRFRARAEYVLAILDDQERALLLAYTAGVNAGLEDLTGAPLEYLALLQDPQPWRPADSILCLYAMFLDLSYSTAIEEQQRALVRDLLPAALSRLLLPLSNRWEAPLQDDPLPGVTIPDSTEFSARRWISGGALGDDALDDGPPHQDTAGSNCWAVAGRLTAHGGALLANDMHLSLGLPNIWYHARLRWPDGDVVGVTLPGTPALVVGSNGNVAWGFTNSYGDWVDLVTLETDPENPGRYRTPDGWRAQQPRREIIQVKGAAPDTLFFQDTIWGPVWGKDALGRPYALRWTAHDPEAVNFKLLGMESVRSVDQALDLAGRIGIPPQNMICADSEGHIGWAIAGRIPSRVGWDGRLPVSWADGSCFWDGYLDTEDQPRIVDPADGLLWTANNRVVSGEDLEVVGDGGYSHGSRARQIRDGLRALDRPAEQDMLAIQLDDRALFMGEWRQVALDVLERHAPPAGSDRAEFLRLLRDGWTGRAEPSSVAYRLARNFSFQCVDGIYDFLTMPIKDRVDSFRPGWLPYRHAVTWEILATRPDHLLPPGCRDWDDFVLQAVDRTIARAVQNGGTLADFRWGARNTVRVEHPLVQVVPFLARWLAAPAQEMPGDSFMPRPGDAWRQLHAPRPEPSQRGQRAPGGLARTRGRGHLPHARRPERPPVLALLSGGAFGVGGGAGPAAQAGGGGASAGTCYGQGGLTFLGDSCKGPSRERE